jgi:predicted KAP-like P-loop ATPase
MWSDNETDRDFLNFTGVSETVAEIIVQAKGKPVSIGVSGAWGVGKSSMIKLIRKSLEQRPAEENREYIFVEFNAWLYQGYDDARAALMEVIANTLTQEAETRKKGIQKAMEFAARINWFRVAKLTSGVAAMALGLPPVGLAGEVWQIGKEIMEGHVGESTEKEAEKAAKDVKESTAGIIRPKTKVSPPKEIHTLRENFEQALEEMGVTLVVLIDDLDRCLPPTTISTLEAVRLFLFLKHTAFVIAADDEVIRNAVSKHFDGASDKLVTNYFDKLIQIPIRVPPLGTQEVRAYMILLFVENSSLLDEIKEKVRKGICDQLARTWQGNRVDRAFLKGLHNFDDTLIGQFDTADRLAPLMTTATDIHGNPRLIKRFMNAISIRMAISRAHGVGVDETVLAKMLLFERLGNPNAYAELAKAVTEHGEGKPEFLSKWENEANSGKELKLEAPWDDPFVLEWLTLAPTLADKDLRGVLYVSREHAPLITPADRLSSEGADLLAALLEHPDMAADVRDRLQKLARPEINVIMDRLLDKARQEQEWGVPPILEGCLVIGRIDPSQGQRLAAFLAERPATPVPAPADVHCGPPAVGHSRLADLYKIGYIRSPRSRWPLVVASWLLPAETVLELVFVHLLLAPRARLLYSLTSAHPFRWRPRVRNAGSLFDY